MTEKITSKAVEILLERKFCAPEWSFFGQVPNQTGGATQIADGMAFNLWPSRGLQVVGFEIKVNRGDWLNELKQPAKSADIQQHCDHWYIVAPKEVVKAEEVPKTWGWYEVQKGRLVERIKAPELTATPVDRFLMAAIMRKVAATDILPDEVNARIKRAREDGEATEKERGRWRLESIESDLRRLKESVAKFQSLTGVNMDSWGVEKVAAEFKLFQSLNRSGFVERLKIELERKRKVLDEMDQMLTEEASKEIAKEVSA